MQYTWMNRNIFPAECMLNGQFPYAGCTEKSVLSVFSTNGLACAGSFALIAASQTRI